MTNSPKKRENLKNKWEHRNEIGHQVMVYYFINVKIAVVRWLSLLTGIPGICNGGFAFVGSMMTD